MSGYASFNAATASSAVCQRSALDAPPPLTPFLNLPTFPEFAKVDDINDNTISGLKPLKDLSTASFASSIKAGSSKALAVDIVAPVI